MVVAPRIARLARFGLITPDASRLSRFYKAALGFRRRATDRWPEPDFALSDGVTLGLGHEIVDLLQPGRPGRPYPDAASASDLCFQHFAIVVTDMAAAYQRLCSVSGWAAISTDGPQRLPASSGGVTAFKFRDPDGHPLELLAFPEGKWPAEWQARSNGDLALGIDHSAISVADSARSIAFYEALGLQIAARSLNSGCEQQRLDGVRHPEVEVTALAPPCTTPHVELLCYRSAPHRKIDLGSCDVAATRLIFEIEQDRPEDQDIHRAVIDPDGHHLVMMASANGGLSSIDNAIAKAGAPSAFAQPE